MSCYGNVFENWRHPRTMALRCTFWGWRVYIRAGRTRFVVHGKRTGPLWPQEFCASPPGAWHTPRQPAATPLAGYSTRGGNLTSYRQERAAKGGTAALMKSPSMGDNAACLQNGHAIRSATYPGCVLCRRV